MRKFDWSDQTDTYLPGKYRSDKTYRSYTPLLTSHSQFPTSPSPPYFINDVMNL